MKLKTKKSIAAITISSLLTVISPYAFGFEPTAKPITVIIPFTPGGGVDQSFRHLQRYAEQRGIKIVASYKPGADGLIGMNDASSLPPDGFNISLTTAGAVAVHRLKNPNPDLSIVSGIRNSVFAIVVNPNKGITSIKDLETKIRKGDDIKFGQGAPAQKLSVEQLIEFMNPKSKPVVAAYKGAGPVIQDLLGGHIDVASVPLSTVSTHIDAGKLKLLAVSVDSKIDSYPDVPSISKFYPKWENYEGYCLVVPKNTSPDAILFWENFLKDYLADPQVQKDFVKDFTEVSPFGTHKVESTVKSSMKKLSKQE